MTLPPAAPRIMAQNEAPSNAIKIATITPSNPPRNTGFDTGDRRNKGASNDWVSIRAERRRLASMGDDSAFLTGAGMVTVVFPRG